MGNEELEKAKERKSKKTWMTKGVKIKENEKKKRQEIRKKGEDNINKKRIRKLKINEMGLEVKSSYVERKMNKKKINQRREIQEKGVKNIQNDRKKIIKNE